MQHIEKYTAHVKDVFSKKAFKVTMDESCPLVAHKKFYNKLTNYQEIQKITDATNNTVYDINSGFINS